MKKTLLTIVTMCLVVVFLSAYSENPSGMKLGNVAPNFKVSDSQESLELYKLKGNYVLLSFWNSVDAESRIANLQYDRAMREMEGVSFVAVNFDSSYGVYQEILKNDALDAESQFYGWGNGGESFFNRYELRRGMKALLLDKSGKILAENPSPSEIRMLIGE